MKTRFRFRRARGAAAVETAILMLVLVPLIMYTLFLEDVLFYRLDLAESVFSSTWDFHHHDYRHQADDQIQYNTQHNNRLTFADHTSVWNTYQDQAWDTDNGHAEHHQALTAHQCWLAKGGKQVTCGIDQSVGGGIAGEFSSLNHGGQAKCHAILGVENYFIPQQFMQWWAKQDMTGQDRWTAESGQAVIHDNARQDPYVFPEEYFSVMADSWALNFIKSGSGDLSSGHSGADQLNPDSHPSNQGNEFTTWVDIPYSERLDMLQPAKDFAQRATSQKILSDKVTQDGPGDDLDTLPLAWKVDPVRAFNSHGASGWQDQRHSQTQGVQQDTYMGVGGDGW
jgi:hypothetical protein